MIPVWTERNNWISKYIPSQSSVIDWGCGTKDTLRYLNVKDYLGIDITNEADIYANFNKEIPIIKNHYDVGLVLGVLEYLDNPKHFLENIKYSADTFYILIFSDMRKKHNWTNNLTSEDFYNLIIPLWKNVSFEKNGKYLLAICSD